MGELAHIPSAGAGRIGRKRLAPYFSGAPPMRQSYVRVLVVDDFKAFREWLCLKLEKAKGFKVVGEAADGLEAVQIAKQLVPDLVLLDVGLPRMDGVETEKQLRRILPSAKVLFVSAYPYRELVQSMSAGNPGYVLKRNAERELLPAMNAMVRSRNKKLRLNTPPEIALEKKDVNRVNAS
jgi:DNA-binding NarL/FixJ family response regulator